MASCTQCLAPRLRELVSKGQRLLDPTVTVPANCQRQELLAELPPDSQVPDRLKLYFQRVGLSPLDDRSCDFTAHMCTGIILSNYKLFVNPLFKLISIEHVIIGSKTQWKTM